MQKLYRLGILIVLLAVMQSKVWAQPGVGATYIGDYSKMSSKASMDAEMANGNWAYRLENLKNNKYNFTITMKDNLVREVRSKLYVDNEQNKSYLMADGERIYSRQTKLISKDGGVVRGFGTDSCWLFKVVSGKINAYSFISDADGPFCIAALQTDDGPVKNFDFVLLDALLKDNARAYKLFLKREYLKAIERYNNDSK